MPHLRQTRKGWENEHLATFLLSQIAFLSRPLTVGDDLGVDLLCTLFSPQVIDGYEQLIPRQSFAIQIKTSRKPFLGDKQLIYFRGLEIPFFVGLICEDRTGIDIFSAEIFPDFFSFAPEKLSFILTPQLGKVEDWPEKGWNETDEGKFNLPLPYVGSLKTGSPPETYDDVRLKLSAICTSTLRNIAAKISEEYIFRYPSEKSAGAFYRIQAGTGSIHTFRGNFMLRLAEVFYNFRRILQITPEHFPLREYQSFEPIFLTLKDKYPESGFVDMIYQDLKRTLELKRHLLRDEKSGPVPEQ